MSEQMKILEMIEKGQISAAEGFELIEALKESEKKDSAEQVLPSVSSESPTKRFKFFKIRVTSDNKSVNVSVNIPMKLLSSIGEVASKVSAVIPAEARREMEKSGVDISKIDFQEIIEALLSGTLEDPQIVDVEAWDEEHQTTIKVKIYAE